MGLLAHYRRMWIAIFLGLLWLPIIGHTLLPGEQISSFEGRALRKPPTFPKTWSEWAELPRLLDAFLADHFGFRSALTVANAWLRYEASSPTSELVLYGRDGYLFYLGEGSVHQSIGVLLREDRIKKFVDVAADLRDRLEKRNIPFLVAIPPNAATINIAHMPKWLARAPASTEYDLMLKMLEARGIAYLDLRPALRSDPPKYERTGTHWNLLGAAVARNEIVRALGHPEWETDIDKIFKGFHPVPGSDLARFLGVPFVFQEQYANVDVSSYPRGAGPTVLVLGDSFITDFFPTIWANGGRLEVMPIFPCAADVNAVMARNPSYVVFAPTERRLYCPS
jgi:alginate O-acetyltransferase complex protein AlgJ